ncbi:MAG: hemolysin family protein [Acidobacteriota bacterium]
MINLFIIAYLMLLKNLSIFATLLLLVSFYLLMYELIPYLILKIDINKHFWMFNFLVKFPYFFLYPFIFIQKRFKFYNNQQRYGNNEADIYIQFGEREGLIDGKNKQFIEIMLEMNNLFVKDVMTPRNEISCIERSSTIDEVIKVIIKERHTKIPVFKGNLDHVIGLILAKDILKYINESKLQKSIGSLIKPVIFVPETMNILSLLEEFKQKKQKIAMVIDEFGGISGLVTENDVYGRIFGEIKDEHDEDEQKIIDEGKSYLIKGDVNLDKIENILKVDFKGENYTSLGGMIIYYLGRMPRKDEIVEIEGIRIQIVEIKKGRIGRIRIFKK